MKLTGLMLDMGEKTNMCKFFVGKPKECWLAWRPRHRWTIVEMKFSCGVHLCGRVSIQWLVGVNQKQSCLSLTKVCLLIEKFCYFISTQPGCKWCFLWCRAQTFPWCSWPLKCQIVWQYMCKCNFIGVHKKSTAFSALMFMKFTNNFCVLNCIQSNRECSVWDTGIWWHQ